MSQNPSRRGLVLLLALLTGCASAPPVPDAVAPVLPPAWMAPVPAAHGAPADPSAGWARFNDPLLLALIEAAQRASPTLASAVGRIERARADGVAAGAALLPQVDAVDAFKRERPDTVAPVTQTRTRGLQASWEIDLFGAVRAARDSQRAQLESAEAAWQAARVSVAAEAASTYVALRTCEALLRQTDIDAASRAETARVSATAEKAGLISQGNAATARASAAQARSQVVSQRAQCDIQIKALVALTALDETELRARLAPGHAQVPTAPPMAVAALPAALLSQRPDLMEAAKNVAAAAAEHRSADARLWPSVRLAGTVGTLRVSTAAGSASGDVWSFGPLQVSFPVFDGGQRRAVRAAALASYTEAVALYQARIRQAVREVEQALVELGSAEQRAPDLLAATQDYQRALEGAQERFRAGFSSVFELEDARRSAAASEVARIQHLQERSQAGIALYRALGGGWSAPAPDATSASPDPSAALPNATRLP